jgi:hypothetical protein
MAKASSMPLTTVLRFASRTTCIPIQNVEHLLEALGGDQPARLQRSFGGASGNGTRWGPASKGNGMSDFSARVVALEAVLAEATSFDRLFMDRAFKEFSGSDPGVLDPEFRRKSEQVLARSNRLAQVYPETADPSRPLPTTALESCQHHAGHKGFGALTAGKGFA